MKHFQFFPRVEYSENIVTNIMVRSKIRELVLQNRVVYYEYDLDDHERPDILAFKYYGTADNTWILFYANEVFDPFYDWLLSYEDFNKYMLAKYQGVDPKDATKSLGTIHHVSSSGINVTYEERITPVKEGDQIISPSGQIRDVVTVISAGQFNIDLPFNNDLVDVDCAVRTKIHSYYNSEGLQIDYKTWRNTPVQERDEKTFFQVEFDSNEEKRRIKVIDKVYYNQIVNEFERIFR